MGRSTICDTTKKFGTQKLQEISGIYANQNTTLCKLMWMKENQEEIVHKTYKFMDVGAYLCWKLTGQPVTTRASAWSFGILDLKKRSYSREILDFLDIREDRFCDLIDSGEIVGKLTKEAASVLGLKEETEVAGGGGDGQCAALGTGLIDSSSCSLNLGSVVVCNLFCDQPVVGNAFRTACGCMGKTYLAETVIPGGMFTVRWFMREFAEGAEKQKTLTEQVLDSKAYQAPPSSMVVLPYWSATAAPYWNHLARGIVMGWNEKTTSVHFYRSILEGIAFEQRLLFEGAVEVLKHIPEKVVVCGGGANSRLFKQILANILRTKVVTPNTLEATCLGAGMIAAFAGKLYDNLDEAVKLMSGIREVQEPVDIDMDYYEKVYQLVYKEFYPSTMPLMNNLAKIQNEGKGHD